MKKLPYIILIICFSTATIATEKVATFGMHDCGQWFSNKLTSSAWLLGYLSGLNSVVGTKNNDHLNKLNSSDQAYLWMDKYCQSNPLSNVQTGGNRLYEELMKK